MGQHLYDGQLSLYDLARQSFGGTVCLREHFRCTPEITQFSNTLSYSGQIRPLRDTTSIKVKPPLVTCCLPDGQRQRDHNDEEALTIASPIAAAIDIPEYAGATFGVIAMVGNIQAALIDKLLRHKLTAAVYEERKLMCGNPAHFHGDERNIVFLSLVDSPRAPGLMIRDEWKLEPEVLDEIFHRTRLLPPSDLRSTSWPSFHSAIKRRPCSIEAKMLVYELEKAISVLPPPE